MTNNGNLLGNLPILDAKNWDRWCVQMEVIFGFQEVLEVVKNRYQELGDDPDDAQQATYKDSKKKDCKALFLIHQSVDPGHFEKIASAKTLKEAWDILVKCHEGGEKLKKVKLQTLKRQFELMQMEKSEKISDYFTRVLTLTNQMKSCGEKITVEKIMRTLTYRFDYIVVAIEESKDLETMKIEELQGSLETHEQRLVERNAEKEVTQALQSQILKNKGGDKAKGWKGKGKWKHNKNNGGGSNQSQDHSNLDRDHGETSRKKGDGGYNHKDGRKRFDRKKIQCYKKIWALC